MLVIIFGIPDIFIRYFLNFFYGPPLVVVWMCGGLDLVVWWFSLLGGLGGYYLCIIIPDSSHKLPYS